MRSILFFMLFFGGGVNASDLLYRHGFEHNALLFGHAADVQSTGLVISLNVGSQVELLHVNASGVFVFETLIPVGNSYTVNINQLPQNPDQQSCIATHTTGTMPPGGASDLLIVCSNAPWNWDEMSWDNGGWN